MKDDRKIVAESWHNFHPLKLQSYWTEIPKFLHDVEALLPLLVNAYKAILHSFSFWNARAKNEGGQFQCLQKAPKLIG